MDTSTINFAIEKLNQSFIEVAPTLKYAGEELVRYTVGKTIIETVIFIILTVVGILFTYKFTKMCLDKKYQGRFFDDSKILILISTIFLYVVTFAFSLITIVDIYNLCLCCINPVLFTLERVIGQ
jgi:heme/copper-type cytochrome/quinol oxidase subunit 2